MLVCVESILVPAIVSSEHVPLIILVVIAGFECWTWLHYFLLCFVLNNFEGIVVFKSIAGSNKTSFFWDKFIVVSSFTLFLFSSKSRHSQIKCVHGPRHCIDKCWLIFVSKTVDFISILFDFLSLLDHPAIWVMALGLLLGSLSIIFFIFIHAPKVNSLGVLKSLYIETFLDSVGQAIFVVRFLLVFFGSMLLRCLVTHL